MVSFHGIGNVVVTMMEDGASVGAPCKMKTGKTVTKAAANDSFQGVCIWERDGLAGVQVGGFVTLGYSGASVPTVGYGQLAADGNGGVAAGNSGPERLIVDVDTVGKTVTFYL